MTDYDSASPSLSPTDSPTRMLKSKAFKNLREKLPENFKESRTPEELLLKFARKGYLEPLKELCEYLAALKAPININYYDEEERNTALMLAAENGHLDVINYLLNLNGSLFVSLDWVNCSGKTAIELAHQNNHMAVGRLLADKGATIRTLDVSQWVELCRKTVNLSDPSVQIHIPPVALPVAAIAALAISTTPPLAFRSINSYSPPSSLERSVSEGMSVLNMLSPTSSDKVKRLCRV